MRSDNQALSTVQDALGLGASKVDTAYTGMNNVLTTIGQIKTKLLSTVGQTDAAKAKTQTEITALQAQMKSFADAATFSGSNFLAVTSKQTAAANDGVQPDAKIVVLVQSLLIRCRLDRNDRHRCREHEAFRLRPCHGRQELRHPRSPDLRLFHGGRPDPV